MENIKNGEIGFEKIELKDLWETIKIHYPSIAIEDNMEYVIGDCTLLLSLFLNLLSNISRTGEEITIIASDHKICLCNKEDFIDKTMLKILNGNRQIPRDQIRGKGFGVSLCHEIANLHHAKIRYDSTEEKGTIVTVVF